MQLYKFNLQQILTTYKPYLENLKKNSEIRIEASKNYQNFLKEVAKKDYYNDQAEEFGINDLQLEETENIMKDLIFMTEKSAA